MYLTQAIHKNLQQRPEQIATIDQGQQQTHRQLAERVAKLAGALQTVGVANGDRVALMSLNSARYVEYLYAIPWAGAALNPVNTRWSAAEVAYSLDDSGTKILIIDDNFAPLIDDILEKSSAVESIIYAGNGATPTGCLNYETLIANAVAINDQLRRGNDLLGVFYTGGTTGFPKGVMLSHNNYCSSCLSMTVDVITTQGVKALHAAPMFHLADLAMLGAVTMRGGCHVTVPAFEPKAVLKAIAEQRVSLTLLVPTMIQMMLNTLRQLDIDISSLSNIIYGASPMPLDTLKAAMTLIPQASFTQAYGMTELSPIATISLPENHTAEAIDSGRIRTAGLPGPTQEVKVVDENEQEVTRGSVGEVIVRGPNVMQGYWGKPEATAEAIVDGWMHTGDGGYIDDEGYLYIVDRVKDMIISGGENIYSAEVENAVTQHPDVAQCAVIGIPDSDWGEAVHAIIVPVMGKTLSAEQIREFSKTLIAGYKCPRSISLAESLPLSGAGKVLKNELRKPYWQGQERNVG